MRVSVTLLSLIGMYPRETCVPRWPRSPGHRFLQWGGGGGRGWGGGIHVCVRYQFFLVRPSMWSRTPRWPHSCSLIVVLFWLFKNSGYHESSCKK